MRLTGRATAAWFAILTGVVMASASSAQIPSATLRAGDRVRLTAPTLSSSPVVGFVVSADGTQLTVDVARRGEAVSEWSIDWDALTRIERFNGYQSNAGKGAWTGLGLGILAGAGFWYLAAQNSGEVVPPLGTPLWYGALGTLGGAIIGSGSTRERWSTLPTNARAGLQLGAPSASFAVGVPDSAPRVVVPRSVLKVGDQVRLTAPTQSPSPIIGRLASANDSKLTIVVSEETRMAHAVEHTIDRESLTLIERREASKSKVGTGALIGGTLGVLAGVGVGFAAAMGEEDGTPLFTTPLIFGSMGMLAGAGIGAAISSERWRALPPDTQVGFRPGMGSEPFAVVIRTTF
jgi:hypothetical protein